MPHLQHSRSFGSTSLAREPCVFSEQKDMSSNDTLGTGYMHDLKPAKGTFFEMSTDEGVMSDSVLTGGVSHIICCQ